MMNDSGKPRRACRHVGVVEIEARRHRRVSYTSSARASRSGHDDRLLRDNGERKYNRDHRQTESAQEADDRSESVRSRVRVGTMKKRL